jgi:hypothetical protein
MSCDATIIPVVTGQIDPAALDDLVALCLQYAGHGPQCGASRHASPPQDPQDRDPQDRDPQDRDPQGRDPQDDDSPDDDPPDDDPRSEAPAGGDGATCPPGPRPPTPQALEMLRHAIIGKAVGLVSGPGGLASFLRTRLLDARLAGPSLPLDVGHSDQIPAAIRRAVILRDQHCRWAGGCDQPASACEVHHVTHLADGGTTSVDGCALYCFFHHQIAIHQWGWKVALHPDGTTTARSPDGTKIFHSHSPPG